MMNVKLSIVLSASSHVTRLRDTIITCRILQPFEIILLTNGPQAALNAEAASSGCKIYSFESGNHENRLPSGFRVSGDVILHIDAGMTLEPVLLRRLAEQVVYGRADTVFLEEPWHKEGAYPSPLVSFACLLNSLLGRPDLQGCSFYSSVFALTRKAADLAGQDLWLNPAGAMVKLIRSGLRIERMASPPNMNRGICFRPELLRAPAHELSSYERQLAGRYLSAFAQSAVKPRGGFTDGNRRRDLVQQVISGQRKPALQGKENLRRSSLYGGKQLSVIIPALNEEQYLPSLLRELNGLEPAEIIVVVNGSSDRTAQRALQEGARVIEFAEKLGTDCGRAIGAFYAKGDILLFVDGDIPFTAAEMFRFPTAIAQGYDLALNDQNDLFHGGGVINPVASAVYSLNMSLGRKDLGVSSMTFVPFAISRKGLQTIGFEGLQCPPRALAASLIHGLKPVLADRVQLEKRNRLRPEKHFAGTGLTPAASQIVGDHIEALLYLNSKGVNRSAL
ncbi:glycosyltransferase family 2 protein [Paenibacillus pinistramenti]|uniref:glycosyltransferase family 2 protein n=1 Tax=Paenibacillus pinistramenti TaxID=1768003 RepID=UPI001108436E|nr:glycosyltransferase [Paenibacillus pinistramenti]